MIKIDEEIELFKNMEEYEETPKIVINGNVNIEIHERELPKAEKIVKNTTQEIRRKTVTPSWKKKIRERDKYVCQCCKERFETKLEVHHIMPFSKYNELGVEDGNGIALCQKCHAKYHNMYKGQENAANFAKFLRDYGNRIYGGK